MATIEGVKIEFYFNEHPPPHFHVEYSGFLASISIDEDVIIKGFIPPAKFAMIRRWKNARKAALRAAFVMSLNHIDPGVVE